MITFFELSCSDPTMTETQPNQTPSTEHAFNTLGYMQTIENMANAT